ncbi:MAG: hypothetical protein U0Z17_01540 [Bacteroidales bacterium]
MPQLVNNETYPFLITLTNKGLITAKDVQINLPQNDPEYEFVYNFPKKWTCWHNRLYRFSSYEAA